VHGPARKRGSALPSAEKMASCGAKVIIADLGKGPTTSGDQNGMRQEMEEIARTLAEKHGVQSLAVDLDVTRNDSIQEMVQKVKERFGYVDVLVNNAGALFGSPSPAHTYNEEAWMKTIVVNLHGVFRVSKPYSPS